MKIQFDKKELAHILGRYVEERFNIPKIGTKQAVFALSTEGLEAPDVIELEIPGAIYLDNVREGQIIRSMVEADRKLTPEL